LGLGGRSTLFAIHNVIAEVSRPGRNFIRWCRGWSSHSGAWTGDARASRARWTRLLRLL